MTARVLVVDDLPANVRLMEARLSAEYFDVVSAANGADAIEAAVTSHPDIVLLDVMMPGMDGFECCRRLRADPRTRHIPVVMVTALSNVQDRVRGLEAGADDFLTKPIVDVVLNARIRSLVRLKMLADESRMRQSTSALVAGDDVPEPEDPAAGSLARVVLVCDDGHTAARLVRELSADRHKVEVTPDPDAAIAALAKGGADLAIVDLALRAADGLRVCARLRGQPETRNLPLLALVEPGDTARLARALDLGVNDCLAVPPERSEMLARVRTQIRRHRFHQRMRANVQQSVSAAVTDSLTGLHNRRFLTQHLDTLVAAARRSSKGLSVLLADIDRFKSINDNRGHAVGDEVIRFVADLLKANIRDFDSVARWGGEEFIIAMPDAGPRIALKVAERLRLSIAAAPAHVRGCAAALPVTVSIGVSSFRGGDDTVDALLRRADRGLYAAKRAGRNRIERVDADEVEAMGPARAS